MRASIYERKAANGLIDLHTHSNASDGSYSPLKIVQEAAAMGLEAVAISDHDTLAGYDYAAAEPIPAGIELVCAIELSTKLRTRNSSRARTVHLLGYFLRSGPSSEFRQWLVRLQESRRDRNRRLADRLQSLGVDVSLAEAEELGGNLTGRPHFAKVLVRKGYVSTIQQAFDVYLDESAKAYVDRLEPSFAEGVERIRASGGLPILPHPHRLFQHEPGNTDLLLREMIDRGLQGIEAYHSEHSPRQAQYLVTLAARYGLAISGGSDFHGDVKPDVRLGTGINCNLCIQREILEKLRAWPVKS